MMVDEKEMGMFIHLEIRVVQLETELAMDSYVPTFPHVISYLNPKIMSKFSIRKDCPQA